MTINQAFLWLCKQIGAEPSEEARANPDYNIENEMMFAIENGDLDRLGIAIMRDTEEASAIRNWFDQRPEFLASIGARAQRGVVDDVCKLEPLIRSIINLGRGDNAQMYNTLRAICWIISNIIVGMDQGPQTVSTFINAYSRIIDEIRRVKGVPEPAPDRPFIFTHPRGLSDPSGEPKKLVTIN